MVDMDKIVSLAKRRGFIFQSSEIYGGVGSAWDYGPLGAELKRHIKNLWWRDSGHSRHDMVGLDAAILMHPMVWKASGHVDHFTDPMVDCRECKRRFRADKLDDTPWVHYCDATKGNKFTIPGGGPCTHCGLQRTLCPDCGKGEMTPPRQFNLMFRTFMGPVAEDAAVTYLRPETAQGIFVNFDNVLQSMRRKLPFGIAQIGKAFRNEITPGNFIFRTREFEQMEIEYFIPEPSSDEEWQKYFEEWREEMVSWMKEVGIDAKKVYEVDIPDGERAVYSKKTIDCEFDFPFGQSELYGLAYRTNFDLKNHFKEAP